MEKNKILQKLENVHVPQVEVWDGNYLKSIQFEPDGEKYYPLPNLAEAGDGKVWTLNSQTSGSFYSAYYADEFWVAGGVMDYIILLMANIGHNLI